MSYTCFHAHVIFATKERQNFLADMFRERLFNYMVGIIVGLKGTSYIINGVDDHVHMLVSLNPTMALSTFVQKVKANSSRWIHETFSELHDFSWQEGYSAFAVSYSGLNDVVRYIEKQQEHHKKMGYLDELKKFLEVHHIEYDPRYLR